MKMVNGRWLRVEGGKELTARERNGCAPSKSYGRCGKRPYRTLDGVVRSGRRWVEMRANPGLSGRMAGKWTGFSHLFPDDSTQVVDFPRMCNVRVFLRDKKTPESWQGNARQRNSQAGLGTNMGSDVRRGKVWDGVESVPTARRPRSSFLAAGPFT